MPGPLDVVAAAANKEEEGDCDELGHGWLNSYTGHKRPLVARASAEDLKRWGEPVKPVRSNAPGAVLAEAIEANLCGWFASFACAPGVEVIAAPDRTSVLSNPGYNVVCQARFKPDEVAIKIAETMAPYKARNWPMKWWTGPLTRPADLGRHLQAHGFSHLGDNPGMVADLSRLNERLPSPPNLEIAAVRGVSVLKRFSDAQGAEQGLAEWAREAWFAVLNNVVLGESAPSRLYVGWLDQQPVASSWLFLGAGVAGVHNVYTAPRLRRRGIGTAMTLAALLEARAMGHHTGVLISTEMGHQLYRRLGFRGCCKLGIYAWSSDPESTGGVMGGGQ